MLVKYKYKELAEGNRLLIKFKNIGTDWQNEFKNNAC